MTLRPVPHRIRVLHIVWDFSQGGLERLVHELCRRMDPDRFDVQVLSLGGLGHFAAGLEGVATLHEGPRSNRISMFAPLALARQIRSIAPHLVHSHSGVWYKAAKAARWARVPAVVHTDHGRIPGASTVDLWLERQASKRTDKVVVVAPWLEEFCHEQLGVPRAKILYLPNGVDTARFVGPGRSASPPIDIPAGRAVIGTVGRLTPIKHYDIMVRALGIVASRVGPAAAPFLVMVGDGPERHALEALARTLDVRELLAFPGWLGNVESLLPWLDVFSLSSRSEGTSLSLLEAMSCGVCPVVTDVGGNPDVLGPDLKHRLVPADDPQALAAAWIEALGNTQQRRQDGLNSRQRVLEHYDLETMIARHIELYLSTIRSEGGRA